MPTIRYIVDDVDACLPFYEALGFVLAERWGPPFAMMKRDGLTLWLSGPGTSARRELSDGSIPVPGGFNRIVIELEDMDAMLSKLLDTGAKVRNEPISGPGGTQALIEDPSGNLIELFEPKE